MAANKDQDEERAGVRLTNLDQELFDGAGTTKRDLVDYLDAVSDMFIPVLADRPLSVIRVLRGQAPFMQKNVPKYTPDFVRTVTVWAESSRREVCVRTVQRPADAHVVRQPASHRVSPHADASGHFDSPDFLILDIDPPAGGYFESGGGGGCAGACGARLGWPGRRGRRPAAPRACMSSCRWRPARRARRRGRDQGDAARAELLDPELATTAFIREDRDGKVFLDATRAGGATVVAAYSPRARPGTTVSFPVGWDQLTDVRPGDFTIKNAVSLLAGQDAWAAALPAPQQLPADLVAEGHAIPIARVAAMHEGKRRARARRDEGSADG